MRLIFTGMMIVLTAALHAQPLVDQNSTVEILPVTVGAKTIRIVKSDVEEIPDIRTMDGNISDSRSETTVENQRIVDEKMTHAIRTALKNAGTRLSEKGDLLLKGSLISTLTNKPRLVPDGTGVRYSVITTTLLAIELTDKKSGDVVLARTFSGIGQVTFNRNDYVPVEKSIELSTEDAMRQITEVFSGTKISEQEFYRDSPGKRLIEP